MWAGIAAQARENNTIEVAISIHDGTYSTDYAASTLDLEEGKLELNASVISDHIIESLKAFSHEHVCKFIGAGVTVGLLKEVPNLCTRLWLEMDIVPIVCDVKPYVKEASATRPKLKHARSGLASGGMSGSDTPTLQQLALAAASGDPNLSGVSGKLPMLRTLDEQADSAARKCLVNFGPGNNPRLSIGFKNNVEVSMAGRIHLVDDLEDFEKSVSKGTWNSVLKYADELREKKVKIGFFSSTPQGGGVALMRHALIRFLDLLDVDAAWYVPNPSPAVFRTTKNNHNILQGVADPSLRFTEPQKIAFDQWIQKNAQRYWFSEGGPLAPGGVDVVFVDDPQMPGLIPMIRKARPDLPIIYRSHIEIRSDLVHIDGSPQKEVWDFLWDRIKLADLFIAHPVSKFVPNSVPGDILGLMPATTDWFDGLNKDLSAWDSHYYMTELRGLCAKERMTQLAWPDREYFVQIARFDPAKGIPTVVDSYCKFRKLLEKNGVTEPESIPQLLLCGHGAVDDPDASIIYDEILGLLQRPEYSAYAKDIAVMRLPPTDQLLNAAMANAKVALQLSSREGFEVKVSEALHTGRPPHGAWINDLARETAGEPYQPGEPRLPRANLSVRG
ncbi:glycosyltransferase family 4 protein [Sphaerobolus stellatus SS14]|uniref:Glycosyltransferase family 4 protein n=1 Tax=Sphaerobolus stellatus (strain SS14) TaxID=990650 RepID=A0A0C9UZ81_SPHS4|nr:glycosyltransferase family 4 protein [Sphaerobolus stellatus SS14]